MSRPCVQLEVILALLREGPASATQMSARIQRSYEATMDSLRLLQKSGLVKICGFGQRYHRRGLAPYLFDTEPWVKDLFTHKERPMRGSEDRFKQPVSAYDLTRRN